jgi:myosin heavy subunit
MAYLIVQIWAFLLLAAVIGALAGWFLRGGSQRKMDKMNQEWSQRLENLELERDEYRDKIDAMNAAGVRQGEMFLRLSEERDVLSSRLSERNNGDADNDQVTTEYRQKLSHAEAEMSELKAQLDNTAKQLAETQESLKIANEKLEGATADESSTQLNDYITRLHESEAAVKQRDEKIEVLHQKLATNLTALSETKNKLLADLEKERGSHQTDSESLDEYKRQAQECEEQLTCAENKLSEVSEELTQKKKALEAANAELATKQKESSDAIQALNGRVDEQSEQFTKLQAQLQERDDTLKLQTKAVADGKGQLEHVKGQLEQTQKALTESHKRLSQVETELRASQLQVSKLEDQADSTPRAPRDYSGLASGIISGRPATHAASGSSRASNWTKLSSMAREGYEKVKEKVEDTTAEVVTATAMASPNDENYRIEIIRSIGSDNRRQLHDMGVTTTLNLLNKCKDRDGVALISKALGRESWVISSWVAIADLLRVKGIDGPMAEVLELSGVYSTEALAEANPEKLIQSIKAVNQRVEKVSNIPGIATVAAWIRHAESLPKVVNQ